MQCHIEKCTKYQQYIEMKNTKQKKNKRKNLYDIHKKEADIDNPTHKKKIITSPKNYTYKCNAKLQCQNTNNKKKEEKTACTILYVFSFFISLRMRLMWRFSQQQTEQQIKCIRKISMIPFFFLWWTFFYDTFFSVNLSSI